MDILELEQKYTQLKELLSEHFSKRTKLLKISEFFSYILPIEDTNLKQAYTNEFIPDFLSCIIVLEIRGLNPSILLTLQQQVELLREIKCDEVKQTKFDESLSLLKEKILLMKDWVNGNTAASKDTKIYFPVLEKNIDGFGNGYLESLAVEIKDGENKFHISPGEIENDEQLKAQIEICWKTALSICNRFVKKIKPKHTVFIHFENRLGIYIGGSLGIALTLSFIEALLKHYNSSTIINTNGVVSFTGCIDEQGFIEKLNEAALNEKLETFLFRIRSICNS